MEIRGEAGPNWPLTAHDPQTARNIPHSLAASGLSRSRSAPPRARLPAHTPSPDQWPLINRFPSACVTRVLAGHATLSSCMHDAAFGTASPGRLGKGPRGRGPRGGSHVAEGSLHVQRRLVPAVACRAHFPTCPAQERDANGSSPGSTGRERAGSWRPVKKCASLPFQWPRSQPYSEFYLLPRNPGLSPTRTCLYHRTFGPWAMEALRRPCSTAIWRGERCRTTADRLSHTRSFV